MTACTHNRLVRELAAADGMCPLCLTAENERLEAIRKAAEAAVDYHRLGYNRADDFDANTMLALMDALGAVVDGAAEV